MKNTNLRCQVTRALVIVGVALSLLFAGGAPFDFGISFAPPAVSSK